MKQSGYNSNKNLILFFTTTLLWTWIAGMIPVILGLVGTTIGTIIFYSGGGAPPSVVALFLVYTTYSKQARKDYFTRCFSLKRMGLRWTLFTIILFLIVVTVGLSISTLVLEIELPGMEWLHIAISQSYMIPLLLFFSIISGPFNEEFGWRGYALDRLLIRYGFTISSLFLGFIWAIWHLPWYFTPGQAQYGLFQKSFLDAFMFIPYCIALSFVVSVVYINTNRSILAGAFVHMMSNFITSQLLMPYVAEIGSVIRYVHIAVCCLVIVYAKNSKRFKYTTANVINDIKMDCERFSKV